MSHNNSMESSNQFIHGQGPSFQQFMQHCYQHPDFFSSMKQVYQANSQGATQNQTQTTQEPRRNHAEPSHSQHFEPQQYNPPRHSYDVQSDEVEEKAASKPREVKKKSANPLAKFIPAESAPKRQSIDEIPIKSSYTEAVRGDFDLQSIKENQSINIENPSKSINFDDMPLRGAAEYQINASAKEEERPIHSSHEVDFEDRPINGSSIPFKEMLKQKCQGNFVEEEPQQVQEKQRRVQPKSFLKRGSRSHLSSAITRNKTPNNKDSSMTKSQLEGQRPVTPKKDGRSTSQNRVLSKGNQKNSQKGISKATDKNQDSFIEQKSNINKQSKPPIARPVKNEPKSVKESRAPEKPHFPPTSTQNSKKKAKNVFRDDSDESSSSSSDQEVSSMKQQDAPYFKATKKQVNNYGSTSKAETQAEAEDLIEAAPGVLVSQKQLDMIVARFGKVKQIREPESQKMAALRKKYTQMIKLMEQEKEQMRNSFDQERQAFEHYKSEQLAKLKSDRRIMERQVKSSHNVQKDKEELDQMRAEIDKEREDFKRKQKNSKIILEKYKKQNEELKNRLERVQLQQTQRTSSEYQKKNNYVDDKSSVSKSTKTVPKDDTIEQKSYKDIKKNQPKEPSKQVPAKPKYDYVEEQQKTKSVSVKPSSAAGNSLNKWKSEFNSEDSESQPQNCFEQDSEEESPRFKPSNNQPAISSLAQLSKMNPSVKMLTDETIHKLFRSRANPEYLAFLAASKSPGRTVVNSNRNNKSDYTAKIFSDRSKQLQYDNGTRKVSLESGYSIVFFKNGDIKQTLPDKTVLYYFKQKEVDQLTLPSGLNIYRFDNNQVEFHFQGGYIQIRHPDGTVKILGGEPLRR